MWFKKSLKITKRLTKSRKSKKDRQCKKESKGKGKNYKQLSTSIIQKAKDYSINTYPTTKNRGWTRCIGRVCSPCSICGTHPVTLVTCPVISHDWGKDRMIITTNGTYPWSFVTYTFFDTDMRNGLPYHGGDLKPSKRWHQPNS